MVASLIDEPTQLPAQGVPMQPIHICNHTTPEAIYPFDARGVAKRFRHAAIFGALDSLHPGETMRFCNDHDPLPLLAQMQARYGDGVRIEYLQREPGAIVIDFIRVG
jgi:uncharacterized protein (DUF2249 family)